MGNSQSSSGTQFASAGLPVLYSVKPCQLFGDPDLYGIGVRVGFYLQYTAAIIAIITGVDREFVGWRAAFVPLVVATFVGLCINSTADTLILMDWAIMSQLVLGFPAFFALPVLFKGLNADYEAREQLRLHKAYIKQITPGRETGFDQYHKKLALALVDLMYVEEVLRDRGRRQDLDPLLKMVEDAVSKFDHVFEGRPTEAIDHAAGNISRELTPLRSAIADLRGPNAPHNIQDLRDVVEHWRLKEREVAALEQVFHTSQDAKVAWSAIREIAKEEKETKQRVKKEGLILKRINEIGLIDTISAGISLIIYSAYCFLAPWLYFIGVNRGTKAGCDVKVLFFLAPISVYSHGFAIFLKVLAIIANIFGLAALVFGLIFLIIGLNRPLREAVEKINEKAKDGADQNQLTQQEPKWTWALAVRRGTHQSPSNHPSVVKHMYEVREWYHTYVKVSSEELSNQEVLKHIKFNPVKWGFWLILLLVYTIVVVEMTIKVNHVAMGTLKSSTGQLIALFVGLFMLLLILYKCSVKLYKYLYKHKGWTHEFTLVKKLESWYHGFSRSSKSQDTESAAGLVNRGQVNGPAGGREPHVVGNRFEHLGDEPLPVHTEV